jgi:hypothetical protein
MGCIGAQSLSIGLIVIELVSPVSSIPQSQDSISKADRDRRRRPDGFDQDLVATGYLRKKCIAFKAFALHIRNAIGRHGIVDKARDVVRIEPELDGIPRQRSRDRVGEKVADLVGDISSGLALAKPLFQDLRILGLQNLVAVCKKGSQG